MNSSVKKKILQLYNYFINSPNTTNVYQKIARDCEWDAIEPYIKIGKFLDVGCGAGYSMYKAQKIGCNVYGIDPDPSGHGVGRRESKFAIPIETILQGYSESLPFEDGMFDTVYSSHVLEHVSDINQSICEMKRVLKTDGIIIIGVPTAIMAWISFFTQLVCTTHQKIVNIFFRKIITTGNCFWWELFIPRSHSYPQSKTIMHDFINYQTNNWKIKIEKHLDIELIIKPCLYPYPEYKQFFSIKKERKISSSVFFICKIKNIN